MSGTVIASVAPDSPAALAGVRAGDHLLSVNGVAPTDVIEYQRMVDGPRVELLLQRPREPLRRKVTVTKADGARLGIVVDSAVFDRVRTCDNHCSFCFIYQLPAGLRRSLYVKDDDFRLSFLYGNYTTLTRFTEFDLERIITEHLSPLYVSIHSTNPALRATMLRNPRGATSLRWLSELLAVGVEVHGQVVVCPGINDGDELIRTLDDLVTEFRDLKTVSLVPVGVSAHNPEPTMRGHTRAEAQRVVSLAERYGATCRDLLGRTLVFASDEFYLVADQAPPSAAAFPSLDQAENGVGLVAAFTASFAGDLPMAPLGTGFFQSVDGAPAWGYRAPRAPANSAADRGPLTVLTGEYAAPILRALLNDAGFGAVPVEPIKNRFFGGNIKVAGLLTGADVAAATLAAGADRTYLLPDVCLSEGRFLDGTALSDLPVPVVVVPTTGHALREALASQTVARAR